MIFSTKNGIFITGGPLETAGLAVALNIENFTNKINRINTVDWKKDLNDLIVREIHTVLAQIDDNIHYPARMLNAGGILALTSPNTPKPFGLVMLNERNRLQLGFGKVELKDIEQAFVFLQQQIDAVLKDTLADLLERSDQKDDFKQMLKQDCLNTGFQRIENILIQDENATLMQQIFAGLNNQEPHKLPSSFGRPELNSLAFRALKNAAIREICEEIQFANDAALSADSLTIMQDVNRQEATDYVRNVLLTDDKAKFSAKEFNADFESITFIVSYSMSEELLNKVSPADNSCIIKPEQVSIAIKDPAKGFLETTIVGYPPVLGGGNQYTLAFICNKLYGIKATCVTPLNALSFHASQASQDNPAYANYQGIIKQS